VPLQELEADVVALMAKRVYDVAGVLNKGCKVSSDVLAVAVTAYITACTAVFKHRVRGHSAAVAG
jgi:hypothetical protein